LLAIFCLNRRATKTLGTTVTTIPRTSTIVILVVAILVFFVLGQTATLFLPRTFYGLFLGAIQAFACFAIFDVGFGSAAVTSVPSTTTVIIVVITVAIALIFSSTTILLKILDTSVPLSNICAVQAFACFAVLIIFGATAITPIPVTASVVIVIVAVVIGFQIWCPTIFLGSLDARVTLCFKCAVTTLACFTIFVVVFGTTTVTLVPVATRVVVVVIAVFISDVIFLLHTPLLCSWYTCHQTGWRR